MLSSPHYTPNRLHRRFRVALASRLPSSPAANRSRFSFYGGRGQERTYPFAENLALTSGVQPLGLGRRGCCQGSVRVRGWGPARSRSLPTKVPIGRTVSHRHRSVLSSARAGTILLSGPRGSIASFGTPRGHNLREGPHLAHWRTRKIVDALPRTLTAFAGLNATSWTDCTKASCIPQSALLM